MYESEFEELCDKLEKIYYLVDKAPSDKRNAVFDLLFESIKNPSYVNMYRDEIIKLSEGKQSLQEYLSEYQPSSNLERTLCFVCYLETLELQDVTEKYISACYQISELPEPRSLTQNIRDCCSSRYQYLSASQGRISSSERGRTLMNDMKNK